MTETTAGVAHRRRSSSAQVSCLDFTVALAAVLLALVAVHGCSNSILRNVGEAAYETVTDAPTPTPGR